MKIIIVAGFVKFNEQLLLWPAVRDDIVNFFPQIHFSRQNNYAQHLIVNSHIQYHWKKISRSIPMFEKVLKSYLKLL